MIGNRLCSGLGNKSHRRNGANIEATEVAFSTHVETAKGGNRVLGRFRSTWRNGDQRRRTGGSGAPVGGDISGGEMQTNNIPVLANGMEVFEIENVADGLDVATDPGER